METLKNEKLSKSAKSQKKEIVDKITKLKEDWPALATINVISDQVKPSKGKDLFKYVMTSFLKRLNHMLYINLNQDQATKKFSMCTLAI